jgi:LytS/YehU family sensor histidine kinase
MMVGRAGELSIPAIVVTEPVFAALGAGITVVMRAAYIRLRLNTAQPAKIAVVSLLASYAGALFWTPCFHLYKLAVAPAVLSAVFGRPVSPLYQGPLLDGMVYHTVILLGWSALYFGFQYYAALQDERERVLRAEARAHQAQLQALRYQLNPHFLFNALNGISTLVTEARTREATDMLSQLSDFLRLTLDKNGAAEVPLATELNFVRRYLAIEQARFGDRLRVRIDVEPEVLPATVPTLVLQPVVENAVKYAVAPREEGGRVTVEAHAEGDVLLLAVCDDGPGIHDDATDGLGLGLANVRDRLHELYGDAGRMALEEPRDGGLCVRLHLPLRLPASSPA